MNEKPDNPSANLFDRIGSTLADLFDETPEETRKRLYRKPIVYFGFLFVILLLSIGFMAYAWGDTNLHVEYKGIAVLTPHWCSAYDKSLWFWPQAKQLPRPDRWQLYATRVRNGRTKPLPVSGGTCDVNDPQACCRLLDMPLRPILPEKYWNSPSWEIPQEYQ